MSLSSQHLLEDERHLVEISAHGRIRVGVGYPNTYRVALSSLSHQWVTRLISRVEDVGVERFYLDANPSGRTIEHNSPLGDMDDQPTAPLTRRRRLLPRRRGDFATGTF